MTAHPVVRTPPKHVAHLKEVDRQDQVVLPAVLLTALRREGSRLTIDKASEHNLDWTYAVRFQDLDRNTLTATTGAELQDVLTRVSTALEEKT